jgi:hypothetical protein
MKQFLFIASLFLFISAQLFGQNKGEGALLNEDTPWLVSEDESEPVQRALMDVQKDWYKVFGRLPIIVTSIPETWKGAVVYFGLKGNWRKDLVKDKFDGKEGFFVRSQQDDRGRACLIATGADTRGAIYAAYTFSEEVLGVDPWSYWIDKEPVKRNEIRVPAKLNKAFRSPTFKYRGWFINDEDILSRFAIDPMRENVISLEMYDRIYETILRLRGNMVVPATWAMPDERCFELASRRGLAVNTSHIQVLGLNTFKWPDSIPYSYTKNPEIMERHWQTSIDAFKDYETIWTVGYRGKFDRPFWAYEPEINTPEARGAVMTRAVAKQVEMVRRTRPNDLIICNLWSEGAEMYQKGFFKLPAGVTIVWADNGQGMIMEKGEAKPGHGVYYHTAVMGKNQLSEMISPFRASREVGRLISAGATEYFLLNVSDVRHYPLSTDFCMKLAWDAKPYLGKTPDQVMDQFTLDWTTRQFGSKVAPDLSLLYKQYFKIPYMGEELQIGESTSAKRINLLQERVIAKISAGQPLSDDAIKDCNTYLKDCELNGNFVRDLLGKVQTMYSRIPEDRKDFYKGHLLYQSKIHLPYITMLKNYCNSLLAYQAKDKVKAIDFAQKALQANSEIKNVFSEAEYGKWQQWFVGSSLPWNNYTHDEIRVLIAKLKGEPDPPIRELRWDPLFYKYQTKFSQNYPLLYPKQDGVGAVKKD